MTTPRRRWCRFSLRTLFVVFAIASLPLGWLAYQLNWIRERHKALADPIVSSFRLTPPIDPDMPHIVTLPPWPLKAFGDEGVRVISFNRMPSTDELVQYQSLFPEANVELDVQISEGSPPLLKSIAPKSVGGRPTH